MKNKTHPTTSRRDFLKTTAAFGALTILPSYFARVNQSSSGISPNEKINLAVIGIGNQGGNDLKSLFNSKLCNVVALCDVDLKGSHTQESQRNHPSAHTFGQTERLIRMAAKHPKLVTQMGNQGHSGANYFQFKAWREAGIIKDITRITGHMNNPRRWHGWGPGTTAPRKSWEAFYTM